MTAGVRRPAGRGRRARACPGWRSARVLLDRGARRRSSSTGATTSRVTPAAARAARPWRRGPARRRRDAGRRRPRRDLARLAARPAAAGRGRGRGRRRGDRRAGARLAAAAGRCGARGSAVTGHERQDHDGRHARGDPAARPGYRAVAAGNVGLPLVEAVLAEPAYDVLAVELSSFQLHWSRDARASTPASVLNIAEDHLDWHGSLDGVRRGQGSGSGATAAAGGTTPTTRWSRELACSRSTSRIRSPPARRRRRARVVDGAIVDAMSGWSPTRAEPPTSARDPAGRPRRSGGQRAAQRGERGRRGCGAGARAATPLPWTAVGAGLRGYRPGRHRNELGGQRRRGRLGRRLEGDQPARGRGQPGGVPVGRVDRRRAAQGCRRRRRWSPSTAIGCAASS